jgi:hypothetical protein
MNRNHGAAKYTTSAVADREAGSAGVELYRETNGKKVCAARLLFWDASGQFALQTFNEIPLDIVEELITEARQTITTK